MRGKKGIFTFNATAALPEEQIIFPDQHDGDEQHPDPHVWFDPKDLVYRGSRIYKNDI